MAPNQSPRPSPQIRRGLKDQFVNYVAGLRFPWLFGITLAIFVFDLVVPDVIPFVEEVLLGLMAAVLASLKKRRPSQVIDATVESPPIASRRAGPARLTSEVIDAKVESPADDERLPPT